MGLRHPQVRRRNDPPAVCLLPKQGGDAGLIRTLVAIRQVRRAKPKDAQQEQQIEAHG